MEVMYAQVGGSIQNLVASEFFTYILPWLFVFAVMYGILSGANIPKSPSARAVISLVSAFAVLPVAPTIVGRLTQLSMGFVIVVSGLLVFIILVELLGIKSGKDVIVVDEKGQQKVVSQKTNIFDAHGRSFAILILIIAILLFASTGGFEILGIQSIGLSGFFSPSQFPLLFFLVVIGLIVWWLTAADKQ